MKKDTSRKKKLNNLITNPFIVIVCDICTIGGFVIAALSQNDIINIIFFTIFGIILAFTIVFILFRWFSIKRAKKNLQQSYIKRFRKTGILTHSFFHNLRNCNNYLDITEAIKDSEFHDKAVNVCNNIEAFFSSVLETDNKTCVCIKLLDTNSISNLDYKEWKTYTFARSDSTDTRRYNDDDKHELITENTDFEILVSNEKEFSRFTYFYSVDLEKTRKQFVDVYQRPFLNSHDNPTYKSAIIVPIRIPTKLASPKLELNSNDIQFHILGFLCIDSDETFNDEDHNYRYSTFKNSIQYACAFADSLYHFFESYLLKRLFDGKNDSNQNSTTKNVEKTKNETK